MLYLATRGGSRRAKVAAQPCEQIREVGGSESFGEEGHQRGGEAAGGGDVFAQQDLLNAVECEECEE